MFGKVVVLSCTLEGQDSGTRGSLDRFEIWKSCMYSHCKFGV